MKLFSRRLAKIFVVASFLGCYHIGWGAEVSNPQHQEEQNVLDIQLHAAINSHSLLIEGRDNTEVINTLLTAGANPNIADSEGYTPLANAVFSGVCKCDGYGNTEIVRNLIAHGANPNTATPCWSQVTDRIIFRNIRPTVLHHASKKGYTEMVEDLLRAGANPNVEDNSGMTPLAKAICSNAVMPERSNIETIRTLLNRGANPNASLSGNLTPLHLAARRDNQEAIELLLHAGANPNATDYQGRTPLYVATSDNTRQILINAMPRPSIRQYLGANFDPYAENIDINQPSSAQAIQQPQPQAHQHVDVQPTPQSMISRMTNSIKNNKCTSIAATSLTVLWGWYLWKKYGNKNKCQDLSIDQMAEEKTGFAAWLENHGLEIAALAGSVGIIALCKHLDNKAQHLDKNPV